MQGEDRFENPGRARRAFKVAEVGFHRTQRNRACWNVVRAEDFDQAFDFGEIAHHR